MPLPAPRPLDALRQHTHAVVLTTGEGIISAQLKGAIDDSGVHSEVIGHPLLAMAQLTVLCRDSRGEASDRLALVVTDRQIDDLSPLFTAIRGRLPRVSIWVFEADLAIEIQRGQQTEPAKPVATSSSSKPTSASARPAAPTLRITGADVGARAAEPLSPIEEEFETDRDRDPIEASGESVSRAELEMLLDFFEPDGDERRPRGDAP